MYDLAIINRVICFLPSSIVKINPLYQFPILVNAGHFGKLIVSQNVFLIVKFCLGIYILFIYLFLYFDSHVIQIPNLLLTQCVRSPTAPVCNVVLTSIAGGPKPASVPADILIIYFV